MSPPTPTQDDILDSLRTEHMTANWTAGIGLAVFPLLAVIGVPVSIGSGVREKEAMVAALLDERR